MARKSSYDEMARAAADRIEAAARAGEQLSLLPAGPVLAEDAGRPSRGKGKAQSQFREYLAARGMRQPEDVLAAVAGLTGGRGDPFLDAMARAEQLLAWANDGAEIPDGAAKRPTRSQRLDAFQLIYSGMIRSNEALLPYGLAKVTPEQGTTILNQIVMPGAAPVAPGHQARDVTPQPGRIAPPPLPHEMQGNQGLAKEPVARSDGDIRTEGTSR